MKPRESSARNYSFWMTPRASSDYCPHSLFRRLKCAQCRPGSRDFVYLPRRLIICNLLCSACGGPGFLCRNENEEKRDNITELGSSK